MTPLGTEPATCLVVQCFIQLHHHVHHPSYCKTAYILYTNFQHIHLTRIYEMQMVCLFVHPSTYIQTVHCSTNSNLVNCVFIQKATYFLVIWTCSLNVPRCGSVNTVTRLQVKVAKKKDLIPGRVRILHVSTIPDWLWGFPSLLSNGYLGFFPCK